MKKKISGILVCMLIIVSILPMKTIKSTSDDNKLTYPEGITKHCFTNPCMKNLPELDPTEASPKPEKGNPPAEFNWKNYQGRDWTTPAKNQGKIGTCDVFAALGALESVINIREDNAELDMDLSEQYVISCLPSAESFTGGSASQVYKYIMDTSPEGNFYNGIIPETCFPYQGKDGVPCSEKCSDWSDHLIPIHGYGFWIPDGSPADRERIKTQIVEKGPVVAGMFGTPMFQIWGSFFHKPSHVFSTLKKTTGSNHAVTLVGWKDDPKILNGGYWIVKNSWGTSWGYDGFFNIAYGCLGIETDSITWVEYDSPTIDSPPVADAGGPYSGATNNDIFFNGSKSFDSEGNIVSYEWDFGDGNQGTGEKTTHSYTKSGVYVVNLTVIDGSGYQDSDEICALIDFWQIGESWTFKGHYYFDYTVVGKLPRYLTYSTNNLMFNVTGETEETYLVEYNGTATGFIKLFPFQQPVKSINLTGNMTFRKKDLGITNYNITYNGTIGVLQIPVIAKMTTEFTPPWLIFPFPFTPDEISHFTYSNVTNNASMTIGNAKPILAYYYYPLGPFGCICEEKGITVPAGTFSTIHLKNQTDTFKRYQFEYYYSPDVRNIVKFSISYNKMFLIFNKYVSSNQNYFAMDLELVAYT